MLFGRAWFVPYHHYIKDPIKNSTVLQLPPSRRNSTVHTPLLLSLFPACLAKHPFLREIRTSHQVCPLNFSYLSTLYQRCIFYDIIYIIRTSTVICSDDIYIYIYAEISTSSERQLLAQPERRKYKDHQQCFFLFFVFRFSSHGRF